MDADYIVVGAGSAGCTVAARLSEDQGSRVLLLEAGPKDTNPMIHIPAGGRSLLRHPVINWNYGTAPEEGSGGRSIYWPRGKVLGGSSSINGMVYVRGNAADFDGWAQMGCRGWSYADVLPHFIKSETYHGEGDDAYRGGGGPLQVQPYRSILPLTHKFVEAAQQAGFPLNADYNGAHQDGVCYAQMTHKGRMRGSTAATYLAAAKGRTNLSVETGAVATKLLFGGKKCTGVAFRQNGQDKVLHAAREVILCGGSVNSPHLLQLSGVGPAAHLQSLGISVVHESPGVGQNLSDHYITRIQHRVKGAVSMNQLARFPRYVPHVFRWLLMGDGALTFSAITAMVFTRSREGLEVPDLQFLFSPGSYTQTSGVLEREPGMSVNVCPARPDSRGSIMVENPDPLAPPIIRPNYLSAESDLQVMLSGVKQTRRIMAADAMADVSTGETQPVDPIETVAEMRRVAQAIGTTIYHPVGTCKMGEDPMAVTDSRLRVHGVQGLRVVDASIMPTLTTGNTNAPSIMIGEKGAAMVREDAAA
ncbi:MAG: choline dehydrogenase [Rhodospirillaceae bacterium]|jgi:choline dehydrogenase|nr:choline dehydrogenase [Rhodospirillaceae bacterium]MBT5667869.1 choline dehydrogenase [Rhodospirillaceae bacterium]